MSKYRKKPVVIEAVQFDKNRPMNEWPDGICMYAGCPASTCVHVHTLEGPLIVTDGDWIIKGIKGEFYPCKPDIFEQLYEKITE